MNALLTTIHVIVCIALIIIVLLQTGKGAEMGAAFGGSSQTLFGSRGAATFLSKLTTTAAIIFMLTSLVLGYMSTRRTSMSGSVIDNVKVPKPAATAPTTTPAQGAPAAAPTQQPMQLPTAPAAGGK